MRFSLPVEAGCRSGRGIGRNNKAAAGFPAPNRLAIGTAIQYHSNMKRQHRRTLEAVFAYPTSANIPWKDIEALFQGLGGEVSEREGSRVAVVLFEEIRVFHRPHPSPHTDKGVVASVRRWLEQHGVSP